MNIIKFDFKEAFKKSIESAELIEIEKKQINDVLTELSNQVHEASNKVITILLNSTEISLNENDRYQVRSMVASSNEITKDLCSYRDSNGGFPVNLRYLNNDATVYDKESLITALEELISSAHSGIIFKSLISQSR